MFWPLALLSVALLAAALPAAAQTAPTTIAIPQLDHITPDGDPADWADRGLKIEALSDTMGTPRPDFAATARLGWDAQHLLALVTVQHPAGKEAASDNALWDGDSVELLVAAGDKRRDAVQLVISPGIDPKHPDPRVATNDMRKTAALKAIAVAAVARRKKTADGYTLEIALPFAALGIAPAVGSELAVQLCINDSEGVGGRYQAAFYPAVGASNPKNAYTVRLAQQPSTPIRLALAGSYHHYLWTDLDLVAAKDLAGRSVTFGTTSNGQPISVTAPLAADGARAAAHATLPMPSRGVAYAPVVASVDGTDITLAAPLTLPDPDQGRARVFDNAALRCRTVFTSPRLPAIDFESPATVEAAVGPYTVTATYYNAAYQQVRTADDPGRYGAVVDLASADGRYKRRAYLTLYRAPKEPTRFAGGLKSQGIVFPSEFGIDPAVSTHHPEVVDPMLQRALGNAMRSPSNVAATFAWLAQASPDAPPATERTGPSGEDQKWWAGLKQHLGIGSYPYLAFTPDGYADHPDRKYPLMIYLHGSGERGSDLKILTTNSCLSMMLTHRDQYPYLQGDKFPFIVIAPQCPDRESWNAWQVNQLVDEACAKYRVDPDRIYVTGLSMGGFGTYAYAMAFPERVAAIVPICGIGDVDDVARIKDIPTWVFHGEADPTVSFAADAKTVAALKAVGGRVRFTTYPGVGHDSWTRTYATPELYTWMLQQRRGHPAEPPAQAH